MAILKAFGLALSLLILTLIIMQGSPLGVPGL